jgi:hypothetical protein
MLNGNNSELHCGNVSLERNLLWNLQPNDGTAPSAEQQYSPSQSPPPPWYLSITFDNTELRFAK